ncbi:hypothetical protein DPMN_012492 [Dreissena polymorpha]|uniref:Uncharacterized protein n=1 Tax=Dreissena polymorpha TaxID=45954 RepID=A0A9D4N2I0_DREPO|nr:hypothetical protein DPMN_012492 [Dreissena polymorpha]
MDKCCFKSASFYNSHINKNAQPTGSHVFKPTITVFELIQDIIGTNLLAKFHDDPTINVASKSVNKENFTSPCWSYIIGTNLLIKFHDDRIINEVSRVLTRFYYSHKARNSPPFCCHVFQPTRIIFKLIQDIIGTNLLIKFHEDLTINVASKSVNKVYYSHIRKNAQPPGSHVF